MLIFSPLLIPLDLDKEFFLWVNAYEDGLDGVLYYESNDVPGRRRLVVPEQLRDKVVTENHDVVFSGHFQLKRC